MTTLPATARPASAPNWFVRAAAFLAAAAAYLTFLPWDLRNRTTSPGDVNETTPVTTLGVVGLTVALLLLAGYLGRRDRSALAVPLVAGPPAALLFVSFATHPVLDADVWPIAWAFFSVLFVVGALIGARTGAALRR